MNTPITNGSEPFLTMPNDPRTPRDYLPAFIAFGLAVALTLLIVFVVRHGADLLGFIATVRAWMTNGGPGI